MTAGPAAKVADVRDPFDSLGFTDAKVSVLPRGGGQTRPRRGAGDRRPDHSRPGQAGEVRRCERRRRAGPEGTGGSFTFTAKPGVTPTVEGVHERARRVGTHEPDGQGRRPRRHRHRRQAARQPGAVGRGRARQVRGRRTPTTSASRPSVPPGATRSARRRCKALVIFFFVLALYLAFRFEWKMSAAAIVAVIHDIIFTDRRLRAVPVRRCRRRRHRVPDDPRFLALRHRRRVRQGAARTNAR